MASGMSLRDIFSRRAKPQGALILPRSVRNHGVMNWPKCVKCMRALDAYGVEDENDKHIIVWGKCAGVKIDPASGNILAGHERVHPPLKSSITLVKTPGWSENRFTDIISRMAFFADDAISEGREFTQDLSAEGVRKKHTV